MNLIHPPIALSPCSTAFRDPALSDHIVKRFRGFDNIRKNATHVERNIILLFEITLRACDQHVSRYVVVKLGLTKLMVY